ncbi:Predicted arabinose efflux permease, MFS family [Limimonas halophila]|uniref:Predicted arabinose efflux permease, MFS family n=1 Tax=Limimonas halophila TaxID=1082479 RepID=A0A1G7L5N6_9PROT|nr:MFS transporter [Limimonas halophila]SDF44817.1 Predicted arabinose efflux permease, MFS family [Limimonas halophila]
MQLARPAALLALVAGMLVLGLNMGLRQSFGLFLEPMTSAYGLSHAAFSLAIAGQNLLWGALQPLCGALADRFGTARMLAVGGATYTAGLVVMALVPGLTGLHLGAGLLVGIAVAATGIPLVLSAVARVAPADKRSLWLGFAATGGSIGQFVLLPGAQALIDGLGWQHALLALAALSVLGVLVAPALRGRADTGFDGEDAGTLASACSLAARHRGYLLLTAGFFVCGFHVAFVATHLPASVSAAGMPAAVGATAMSLIGLFNIGGSFAAGWAGQRWRKTNVLTGIYLGRAAAIAAFMAAPAEPWAVYAFASVFGVLWLGTVPLTGGVVGQIVGARYMATLFGVVMFSHQIGAFCGAWLGGLSFDLTGSYTAVWAVAAGLGVLAAALHWPITDTPARETARTA